MKSLYKEEKIKLKWEALHKWYYQKQTEIKVLFDNSLYVPELYTDNIKTNLSRSINNKLDMIFGIKVSRINNKEDFYKIKKQFIDTFVQSSVKISAILTKSQIF